MNNKNGWWLPSVDSYFANFVDGGPGRSNGFQRDHLLAAFDHVEEWECAIDCGAHVGFWTYDMAQRFKSVHAFEPAPDTFECLQKNMEEFPHVSIYRMALGEKIGTCAMREDPKREGNTGSRFIGEGQSVPMTYLDAMDLRRCGLLKIDVEGYELRVLEGARMIIERCRPVVIMETDKKFAQRRYNIADNAAETWLLHRGYREVAHMRPDKVFAPE